jgi:hypothetical protein
MLRFSDPETGKEYMTTENLGDVLTNYVYSFKNFLAAKPEVKYEDIDIHNNIDVAITPDTELLVRQYHDYITMIEDDMQNFIDLEALRTDSMIFEFRDSSLNTDLRVGIEII